MSAAAIDHTRISRAKNGETAFFNNSSERIVDGDHSPTPQAPLARTANSIPTAKPRC
jgi:hypothetical protein